MHLLDIVNRTPQPKPWSEGDKIPWSEPAFSARMLKEHLSQNHDMASRRAEKIECQVAWIHQQIGGRPGKILDLGCGPGLYTCRLARLGHQCTGIDFSPASIAYAAAYAADQSNEERRRCTYLHQDIRIADYGSGYDLVMLIFGEFNVFSTVDATNILRKAYAALAPGGLLLLEPHTLATVEEVGKGGYSWYSTKSGLFSEKPHLCLTESSWDEQQQVAMTRFFIVDASSGAVTRYAECIQGYRDEEYTAMLADCGFETPAFFPSLTGSPDPTQSHLFALTAHKPLL